MRRASGFVLVLAAAACAELASAADTGRIFQSGELDEAALLEALTPPARTRSITARPSQPRPADKAAAAWVPVLFATNSAALTNESMRNLDIVARVLHARQLAEYRFAIEGHADPRGTVEHNLRLSLARAGSVMNYLVSRHGVPESRLYAIGKGSTELANTAVQAAPENRRVRIVTIDE